MANGIQIADHGAVTVDARGRGAEAIEAYLADIDVCEKSRTTYRRALRNFTAWLDPAGVGQATRADIMAYKRHLEDTYSAATTSAYLVAVRGLYAWLAAQGIYPDVAQGIRGARQQAHSSRDALTVEQARALISDEAETVAELRNRAMINLMLRRGLRTIEVARADIGDLRQMGGEAVLYVQGKGHAGKDDFVVLGDEVLRPINAYLATRSDIEDDAPLFAAVGNRNGGGRMTTRSISRIVRDAYRAHGIVSPRITAHSLRHSCVTLALMGGATVQEAQGMARHADISVTLRYAHNLQRTAARAERGVDAILAGGTA